VDKGHRTIGYVGGPSYITTFRDRLAGLKQALQHHRLRPGPCEVTPSDPEQAQEAAARLFRRKPAATAVIAANLWLAIGTLRAAPEDVAIVGFDDFFLADVLRRPITTIAQPVEELGRRAVSLLLEEIADPGGNKRVVLPPRLIVRGGTR
jgi:LacI family transcriptional regulator